MFNTLRLDTNTRRLFRHFFKYWKRFLVALVAALLISSVDASLPMLLGKVVDIINRVVPLPPPLVKLFNMLGIHNPSQVFVLNFIVGLIIVILVFKGLFSFLNNYLMAYINQRIIYDLRAQMAERLLFYKISYFDKQRTGQIISRFTNDIVILQSTTSSFKTLLQSVAYILVILSIMFTRHFKLTFIALLVYPVSAYVMKNLGKKIKRAASGIQQQIAQLTNVIQEIVAGIRVIKIFSREEYEQKRFEQENKNNYSLNMRLAHLDARLGPILQFLSYVSTLLIFWIAAYLMIKQRMSVGTLIEFLGMVFLVYKPIKNLGQVTSFLQKASVSAGRIYEIIDYPEVEVSEGVRVKSSEVKGRVEFEKVTFSYTGRAVVLRDLSFTVEPGQKLAIVGPSGSGKSTIAALLFRLYDVQKGTIRIDGQDIRELDVRALRALVGLVPQDTFLFSTSIYENIRYGKLEATREEVIEAAKLANAYDFIMRLPQGFDTLVGERGVQLSGGERQRISIARTLLKNPKILILDEATSSLDTESEKIVQEALDRLAKNRTTITIAHRLSTIINSDNIIVLENGRIVETGTHKQLLERKGMYYKLCRSQYITT